MQDRTEKKNGLGKLIIGAVLAFFNICYRVRLFTNNFPVVLSVLFVYYFIIIFVVQNVYIIYYTKLE